MEVQKIPAGAITVTKPNQMFRISMQAQSERRRTEIFTKTEKEQVMIDPKAEDILFLIVCVVAFLIALLACGAVGWLIECIRDARGNKKPEPEQVGHTVWSNVIVESRKTGNRFPAYQDSNGVLWCLGGEEAEPQKLNSEEWVVRKYA